MWKHAILLMALVWPKTVSAQESSDIELYEQYAAKVIRVIDGDTIEVEVDLWPGLVASYAVRIRGIDAPETWRPDCVAEKTLGIAAQRQAEKLYEVGRYVRLENVQNGSFAGRVVADVKRWRSDRWLSFADEMLERGMVVEWWTSKDDYDWCE